MTDVSATVQETKRQVTELQMSDTFRIVVAVDLKAGTDRLLAEAQRYGRALNAVVDIIHVAAPDPDFVGYIKSPDPANKTGNGRGNVDDVHDRIERPAVTLRF